MMKVYGDRISPPFLAVILFLKVNGIDFEEIQIDVLKSQQHSPEYKAINPMSKVPTIVDGRFKLFESHAILIYLCCAFPGVASHCVLAPQNGFPSNPQAAKEAEKILLKSLSKLESFWLKDGRFLVGSSQPSIADLSLVCEIMQLEFLSEKERDRILSPHKKILQWIEDTKSATAPHFDEVHYILYKAQKIIRERMTTDSGKNELKSKL